MLSREFLARVSKILGIVMAREMNDGKTAFGGLNVVLVVDFHQFPPVVCHRSAPLFYPNNPQYDKMEEIIGCEIYKQFKIVVHLMKQIQVEDPIWQDLLQHVRYRSCRERHICLL